MPITNITYNLVREIRRAGLFPSKPHVLEIGESNWYGDVPYEQLQQDIDSLVLQDDIKGYLKSEFARCVDLIENHGLSNAASFDLSRIFYKTYLDYESYTAVDLGGSSSALKLDLNNPIDLDRQYEITISFGTAEHVFNVFQFFKTLHEVTRPGGIIIISAPFQGWVDHGFFNFQPTFYYDLAATNDYNLLLLLYSKPNSEGWIQVQNREQISELVERDAFSGNGTLFATFQKSSGNTAFSVPMQGYYNQTVSKTVADAWRNNR
ncbi:MAG TPA: hypothetical protein ENJ12_06855 [Thiolapillus brandeum]|uniref:Class I SAM-dependent methyltransferase n=1 Tax=Thiolapillus brandeum TaxID=1076588 RepID=A0A831RT16_9GAMM|nr:hypothetical protein [Thiolapillus brandeum]